MKLQTVQELITELEQTKFKGKKIGDDVLLAIHDLDTGEEIYFCDCACAEGELPADFIVYDKDIFDDYYDDQDVKHKIIKPALIIYLKGNFVHSENDKNPVSLYVQTPPRKGAQSNGEK